MKRLSSLTACRRRVLKNLVVLTTMTALPAMSATREWVGGGLNLFADAANWNPAGVPSAGDELRVLNGEANIVTGNDLTFALLRITRNANGVMSATVNQTGGKVTMTGGSGLRIGDGNREVGGQHVGTLNLSGSSEMFVNGGSTLMGANSGKGTLAMSGNAQFSTSVLFTVGDSGEADVTLEGSSKLTTSGEFRIGFGPFATGSVTVSDNAELSSTGTTFTVGRGGSHGTLTVNDNAVVSTTNTIVVADVLGGGGEAPVGTIELNGGVIVANAITEGVGSGTIKFNGGIVRAGAASDDFFADFESEDLQLIDSLKFDTNGNDVTITQALSGAGGVAKLGSGTLTFSSINVGYLGDTIIDEGTLSINSAFLASSSAVWLTTGATFDLSFVGSNPISELYIDGVAQGPGTYDSSTLSGFITGTGALVVAVPEPADYALGIGALLGIAIVARRRRMVPSIR